MRFIEINQSLNQTNDYISILKACGMTLLFFVISLNIAHAGEGGRFSQVSFNDMINQTISISHGNKESNQFKAMSKNIRVKTYDLDSPNSFVTQNEPVVNTQNDFSNNSFGSSDLINIQTAKSSLAVMHALSEICPHLLDTNQIAQFNRGFDNKLKLMLPNIQNPKSAMRYLSTQQDYRRILSNMKAWQMNISDAENLAVCKDILSYR